MALLEMLWYVEVRDTSQSKAVSFFDLEADRQRYFFDNEDDAIAFMVARIKDEGVNDLHYGTVAGSKLDIRV